MQTVSSERRGVLIYTTSDKQEMIKRMIQRQYDQLLEVCNQTKAEVEQLDRGLKDSDFVQRLEVEKMQELIFSIEHDVQVKKQELYNAEIKNRYQHLMNLYQQTSDEIRLLEATLDDNAQFDSILGNNAYQPESNRNMNHNWPSENKAHHPPPNRLSNNKAHHPPTPPQNLFDSQAKRERLDLSMPTEPRRNDVHYEHMLKKWYESLDKINELEEQQQIE